ncbi:GspMb/PilO family protein [Thalassospira sp.]|uniref:GspMb/PilO family protein n=1 Tax=Thalassospira sp. TaxID=1912094 RepID=UPI0032EE1860
MNSSSPHKPPLSQRLISVFFTIVLMTGATIFLYWKPASQVALSRQQISDQAENLESLKRKIGDRSRIAEYVSSATSRLEETEAVLHSPTYSLAGSSLQVLVSDLAKKHGLVVRRLQSLPRAGSDERQVEVRLRLQAVAKNIDVASFLQEIESQPLLINIDLVDLAVRRAAKQDNERSYIEDIDIDVTAVLSALWRRDVDL